MMPKPSLLDDLKARRRGGAAQNHREIAQTINAFANERASENDRPQTSVGEF